MKLYTEFLYLLIQTELSRVIPVHGVCDIFIAVVLILRPAVRTAALSYYPLTEVDLSGSLMARCQHVWWETGQLEGQQVLFEGSHFSLHLLYLPADLGLAVVLHTRASLLGAGHEIFK